MLGITSLYCLLGVFYNQYCFCEFRPYLAQFISQLLQKISSSRSKQQAFT
jgi:hypothetical protein